MEFSEDELVIIRESLEHTARYCREAGLDNAAKDYEQLLNLIQKRQRKPT